MKTFVLVLAALLLGPVTALDVSGSADLHARTVAAFERYAVVTEARIAQETSGNGPFIFTDGLGEPRRAAARSELRSGQLVIQSLTTRDSGRAIDVPDGLIHHWVGVVFVPGVPVAAAVTLLQDYDRHASIFAPNVARSKTLARSGDDFRVYLRFYMQKVLTVVLDTEHQAHYTRPSPDRAFSRIVSTRIAELENPGTAQEHEKPIGQDGGYMWRLHTYWRFLERDGGTYIQCESISLTRGIPFGLGWAVGPFVTSIPRESLTFTLETTRKTLLHPR